MPDRAALTGILFALHSGIPWEMLPQQMGCGSDTTGWRRLRDWREAGVWDRILNAVSAAYDGDLIMIDSSCVRVHQHGATGKKGIEMVAWDVPVAA